MSFAEFQDGGQGSHLGYWNGTISAVLNLYVAQMSPIKFWLNLTWLGRCRLKNFKMIAVAVLECNDSSNSESLCHSDASHQASAYSDLQFGRCHLKNFTLPAMAAIPDIGMEQI